jgi:hypothetical protein
MATVTLTSLHSILIEIRVLLEGITCISSLSGSLLSLPSLEITFKYVIILISLCV